MAKIIRLTPECIEQARKEFEESLTKLKLSDGKISFTKSFTSIERKAAIYFTELAWLKMTTLVREFDKEVAWHGIATRGEDETKDEYFITDILVYPQEVTGATVTTDQEEYEHWLDGLDNDVFNNLRMQGHSHVNMGTSPSSVDLALYSDFLSRLGNDMFYIFMIWNKRFEKTIKVYDMRKNTLFETSDCTVYVLDDGTGIEQFVKDAKAKVKTKTYVTYGAPAKPATVAPVAAKTVSGTQETKKEEKKESTAPANAFAPARKGKRKKKSDNQNGGLKKADNNGSYYSYGGGWFDEEDDPYGAFGYADGRYYW